MQEKPDTERGMSSWIYLATKDELTLYAAEFGLETTGKNEELRRLVSAFAKRTDHNEETKKRLFELSCKHKRDKSPAKSHTPEILITEHEEKRVKMGKEEDIKMERKVETEIVDRVRSWGIRYLGSSNPLEFIDKMEQWASGYGIKKDQLVQTMPFILEGVAIDWWNTTPTKIETWEQLTTELVEYFLPPRYEEQMETQIAQLRQREDEPVREYAMGLRKLMRFTKLSEEEKLDRIYRNCRSKIKLYTRRAGFESLTQFLKLAEEVEEIESSERRIAQPAQPQLRPDICMRCGGTGHVARACTNPPRLFCWVCGRNGIRTTECCRTGQGNAGSLSR